MDPIKAARMGIKPEDIKMECRSDKFNGWWFIHVPARYDERGYAVVTSSRDIWTLIRWRVAHRAACNGA